MPLQLGPPQGKVAPLPHPPHCHLPERALSTLQADPGSEGSSGPCPGQGGKRRKALRRLSMGKQAGGRLPPWNLHGAPQNPTLKQRGPPPPAAPSKWRGPRLPLAGLPLPKHRDSPAGQERQLNAVKIAFLHVLRTRAAAGVWRAQPEEGGRGEGGNTCSRGPASSACPLHPAGRPGQAQLPPGHQGMPPRDLRRGGRGHAGSVASPKWPFGSAPPLPSLG